MKILHLWRSLFSDRTKFRSSHFFKKTNFPDNLKKCKRKTIPTASCVNQNMIPRTRRESKNVATFRRNINNTNTNNANVINLKVEVLSWKLLLTVSIQNQW